MPGHSNNIEIICDAYDGFRTGNIEAILATMTPTSNGGLKRLRRHSASHEIASHEIIENFDPQVHTVVALCGMLAGSRTVFRGDMRLVCDWGLN
jgi:hypothetical protein